jgi:thiol-disulfide isomerase/thioredoxin
VIAAVAAVLATLLVIAGIIGLLSGSSSTQGPPKNALVGTRIPGFGLPGLPAGEVQAPWVAHRPGVLLFFADWCAPCHEEVPRLAKIIGPAGYRGVAVLGVDGDLSLAPGAKFVRASGVRFPVGHDATLSVSNGLFHLTDFPATAFVNARGKLTDLVYGALTNAQLRTGVASLR